MSEYALDDNVFIVPIAGDREHYDVFTAMQRRAIPHDRPALHRI
jgi:hypothetical protein